MALSSALAQEGVSRVSSYISTKIDGKASRAEIVRRLEIALSRLAFALEMTGKMPITYVSLLQRWKILKGAHIEGTYLLSKHKLGLLEEGQEEIGRVVVRRSSYLQRFASTAKMLISSLLGLNNEHFLSSSVAREFELYADCADKFVADVVVSSCPLQRDTFFRYPFVRELFEGKNLRYKRTKGSQELWLDIFPVISEGRGLEACMWYRYFDPESLDKSIDLWMMLRLSKSTDIVGIAMNCLRSSASLLNLMVEDAIGELTLLSNLQETSSPYGPLLLSFIELDAFLSRYWRPDPVCCHANVHKSGVKDVISSDLSHIFPEQVIYFGLTRHMPAAAKYILPRASYKAGRIRNVMMIDRQLPFQLSLFLAPHHSLGPMLGECYLSRWMGSKEVDRSPYGRIQETIDTVRSEAIDYLIREPETTYYVVTWSTNHGYASFWVKKPSLDGMLAAVSKGSGRFKTRSGAKRKR